MAGRRARRAGCRPRRRPRHYRLRGTLGEGVPRLYFLEHAQGGHRARKLIDAELGMVVDVLQRSTYTVAVGKRLYCLAAELGKMAGWASFDAGLHASAQRYWVAGLHAAHAA